MTTLLHLIQTPGLWSQCNFIGAYKYKRRSGKGRNPFLNRIQFNDNMPVQ